MMSCPACNNGIPLEMDVCSSCKRPRFSFEEEKEALAACAHSATESLERVQAYLYFMRLDFLQKDKRREEFVLERIEKSLEAARGDAGNALSRFARMKEALRNA